jgi:hypothetical protein
MNKSERKFTAEIVRHDGKLGFVLPFLPDDIWASKPLHHVSGSVGGHAFRGKVSGVDKPPILILKPVWLRNHALSAGDRVEVILKPEGPQRELLDPDIAGALQASPCAAAFFDGLAQFYRKAYLNWIAATKKSPEERRRRITETVRCLEAGLKERPKSSSRQQDKDSD